MFKSPFGYRMVTYCDYVASGRALTFIEDYVRSQVLTMYANTHTSTSVTGYQSSLFRLESRQIVRNNTNCSKKDILLFTGSGSTSALNKLIHLLNLDAEGGQKAIVFVGPYEHHSNILPWRESRNVIKVVNIKETSQGHIDVAHLESQLKEHSNLEGTLLIGAFSAASNITGILSDTIGITILLHKYKAFAVWDYACAAPYVNIDMNPNIKSQESDDHEHVDARKDAIFFSPHKFIGGVETPGVLIVKKHMFLNEKKPQHPGGGTVFFVTDDDHTYLKKKYEREEGGTPSIVGSVRTGLIFQLKKAVGDDYITKAERSLTQRATEKLVQNPNLVLLGPTHHDKLPIFSFLIKHDTQYLHYGFVSIFLNDLFGIQTRGGCACAGPYGLRLLGMDQPLAKSFEKELLFQDVKNNNEQEFLRPGFTRINLNYFFDQETVDYVLWAISFACEHAWKFLPQYTFYPETGEWYHINNKKFSTRRWLSNVSYQDGKMTYRQPVNQQIAANQKHKQYDAYKKEALLLLNQVSNANTVPEQSNLLHQSVDSDRLRWFLYPSEAYRQLINNTKSNRPFVFIPKTYPSSSPLELTPVENICVPQELDLYDDNEYTVNDKQEESPQPMMADVPTQPSKKNKLTLWPKVPAKKIMTPMKKAIKEFEMIKDGDRILLGLSGGKDSLTLLHCLKNLQRTGMVNFEFGACTVDPQTDAYDPSPLKKYLAKLGVPYFFESQNIIEVAKDCQATSICSWCSRMKRGILYNTARREGYNVLALGQHIDDLAESFMMSIFHNGFLRTMKAHYTIDEGDLRVIRPLVYVREKDLKIFAQEQVLPVINENCPACFEIPKERARVKTLLSNQEHLYPHLFYSIQQAMRPLMDKDMIVDGHKKFKRSENKYKKSDEQKEQQVEEKVEVDVVEEKEEEEEKQQVTKKGKDHEHKRRTPSTVEMLRKVDTDALVQELMRRGIQLPKK
ncbi:ttcA [Acrasis kona]|uniref:TtcA n=1 Tax=Acrasis kona TaxID=1008807 RepID=A0AAW2Z7S7_9EUKA